MIRNQGMNQQYYHEVIGYNFRMTNLVAAIGVAQLQHLPVWTEQRIANAKFLSEHIESVKTPVTAPDCTHVYHQYTVRVPEGVERDAVVKQLNDRGIGARIYYPIPIHCQPVIQEMDGYKNLDLPETDKATRDVFSLPVHPALTTEELDYIVKEVNAAC
jgi:dTDP-4-amino-4,6-dideoxygalactose transaminase